MPRRATVFSRVWRIAKHVFSSTFFPSLLDARRIRSIRRIFACIFASFNSSRSIRFPFPKIVLFRVEIKKKRISSRSTAKHTCCTNAEGVQINRAGNNVVCSVKARSHLGSPLFDRLCNHHFARRIFVSRLSYTGL